MTIRNSDILDCPQHGLFHSPDYWPCPFCFSKEPIKEGPPAWSTTFIMWKGLERVLTLYYVPTLDLSWAHYVIYQRKKK